MFFPLPAMAALAVLTGATSRPGWERSDAGATAIVSMQNAPFPHSSRQQGFTIGNRIFPADPHYTDSSVALFVPKGYRPQDRTDLLFYFHGHGNNVRKSLQQFQLREQIAASGANVILVFPQGPKDATDSGGGRLEEPGALRRLAEEAMAILAAEGLVPTRRIGRVLLAGHSGAYRVISFCLEQGGLEEQISDVCLLDASYGRLEAFVDWASRRPAGRMFSIFTDHLAGANVWLLTHLRKKGVSCELLDAEDASDAMVAKERVLFLHASKLTHDETVQWLERWLKTRTRAPRRE